MAIADPQSTEQYFGEFFDLFFPLETFPVGEMKYAGQTIDWYLSDREKVFRRDPPAGFSADSVKYQFNKNGFRSPEFSERGEFNILVIGCSHTFGVGLAVEDCYPEILRQELSKQLGKKVQVWNLAYSTRGNDYITQALLAAVDTLKPDAVYVHWTGNNHRNYIAKDLTNWAVASFSYPADGNFDIYPPETREIYRSHQVIDNLTENVVRFARYLKTVEYLLHNHGIFYLCSAVTNIFPERDAEFYPPRFTGIDQFFNANSYTDLFMHGLDRARDKSHWGRKSHRDFAERLAPVFCARYQDWKVKIDRGGPSAIITPHKDHRRPNARAELARHFSSSAGQETAPLLNLIDAAVPLNKVPATDFAGSKPLQWIAMDSQQRFNASQDRKNHPADIEYAFNSKGYRTDEFDARGELNLIVAGSSETFGVGVGQQDTYGEVLQELLSRRLDKKVKVWNLALANESSDYVARTLLGAIPALQPDAVFVHWPPIMAREFFATNGHRIPYFHQKPEQRNLAAIQSSIRPYVESLDIIGNEPVSIYSFILAMSFVREAAKAHGAAYFYSGQSKLGLNAVTKYLQQDNAVDFHFESIDKSRDGTNPGPLSHRQYAEKLADLFETELQSG